MSPSKRRVRVGTFGMDGALRALVADVLADLGVRVAEHGTCDVVLAVFDGSLSLGDLLRETLAGSGASRVMVILPIELQELADDAERAGASGVYVLGTSLKLLELAVLRALWSTDEAGKDQRPTPPSCALPGASGVR